MTEADDSELFALLYKDLKRRAHGQLQRMGPDQTLQPTALVHEAYARLQREGYGGWNNRSQFFAIAVRAMRDVLIETLRRKQALKRGGDQLRVTLDDDTGGSALGADDLMILHDVLGRLEAEYPDVAQLVLLRFLAGFTIEEIAELQQVSTRTVERRWRFGRAWLQTAMKAADDQPA